MRKNIYTKAVDELHAPGGAVDKMLDTARNFNKEEKIISMKKFKIKGAVAASLAALVAIGGAIGVSLTPSGSNSFVMTVNAAQLKENNSVAVSAKGDTGLNISEGDDDTGFFLDLPFECKGENIDTITYSVDKGAIHVANHKDNNPVVKGTKSKMKYSTPLSSAYTKEDLKTYNNELAKAEKKYNKGNEDHFTYDSDIDNELMEHYESNRYSSITLAYDNQHPDGSVIEYIGSTLELSKADQSYLKAHMDDLFNIKETEESFKAEKICVDKLIGGDVIHCTVKFKNGEEKSQDIVIGTKITNLSKTKSPAYEELPDKFKSQKDYKDVFVTFSVK